MTITANRVGVWILDDTYKKVSSGCWVYSAGGDPPSPGELWLWGCSGQGQLGDNTTVPKSSPIQIPGTSWGAVRTGQYHTLATKTDGTLWSWGRGTEGRLGDNTTIHRSSPVQIPGTSWINVGLSYSASLATKTDGTLWAWEIIFLLC